MQTFWLGSRWVLVLDSELNSVHFGKEINKCLKFLRPKIFLGLKYFKVLLISIPKCIELNSESKPKNPSFFGSNVCLCGPLYNESDICTKDTQRFKFGFEF